MRWKMVMLAAALFAGSAGNALAQESGVELTPLVGYRWGGSLSTVTGLRDFDTVDDMSYGVGLGRRTPGNSMVEINWTHFQSDIEATLNNGARLTGGPIRRDDIMLSGYWYAYRGSTTTLPYITAGLGCSVFSSDVTETVGRFAWNIGVGIRKEISEKAALRINGIWIPTWVTTGTGVWCDPFYCYGTGTGEFYDQFELSAGLILKL